MIYDTNDQGLLDLLAVITSHSLSGVLAFEEIEPSRSDYPNQRAEYKISFAYDDALMDLLAWSKAGFGRRVQLQPVGIVCTALWIEEEES